MNSGSAYAELDIRLYLGAGKPIACRHRCHILDHHFDTLKSPQRSSPKFLNCHSNLGFNTLKSPLTFLSCHSASSISAADHDGDQHEQGRYLHQRGAFGWDGLFSSTEEVGGVTVVLQRPSVELQVLTARVSSAHRVCRGFRVFSS